MASGSGWNLCVWLVGVVVSSPTPLVSVLFCSSIPTFCSFLKCFSFLYIYLYTICSVYIIYCNTENPNKLVLIIFNILAKKTH